MLSFGGDGDRRIGPLGASFPPVHGSNIAGAIGGVRTGEAPRGSGRESAWKNLSSCCGFPSADNGGDGIYGLLTFSSCCPLA
jgi:hypothetical protein